MRSLRTIAVVSLSTLAGAWAARQLCTYVCRSKKHQGQLAGPPTAREARSLEVDIKAHALFGIYGEDEVLELPDGGDAPALEEDLDDELPELPDGGGAPAVEEDLDDEVPELPDGGEAPAVEEDLDDGYGWDSQGACWQQDPAASHFPLHAPHMTCNSTYEEEPATDGFAESAVVVSEDFVSRHVNLSFDAAAAPSSGLESLCAGIYALQVTVEAMYVKPSVEVGDICGRKFRPNLATASPRSMLDNSRDDDLGTADQASKSPRSAALVGSGPPSSRQSAVPAPELETLIIMRPADGAAVHSQQSLHRVEPHRRSSLPGCLPSTAAIASRILRAAPDRCSSWGGCSSAVFVQLMTPVQPGGDNNATASAAALMQGEWQQEEKADQVEEQRPAEQEDAVWVVEEQQAQARLVQLRAAPASRTRQSKAQPQARWIAPASKPVVHKLPTQRAESQGQHAAALVSKEGRRQQVQSQQSEERRQRQPPHQELQRQRRQAGVEVRGAQAVQPRWR